MRIRPLRRRRRNHLDTLMGSLSKEVVVVRLTRVFLAGALLLGLLAGPDALGASDDPHHLSIHYLSVSRATLEFRSEDSRLRCVAAPNQAMVKKGERIESGTYVDCSCTTTIKGKHPAIFIKGTKHFISAATDGLSLKVPADVYEKILGAAGVNKENITVTVRHSKLPVALELTRLHYAAGEPVAALTNLPALTKVGLESGLTSTSSAPTVDSKGQLVLGNAPAVTIGPLPCSVTLIVDDKRHTWQLWPRSSGGAKGLHLDLLYVSPATAPVSIPKGTLKTIRDGMTEDRLKAALHKTLSKSLGDNINSIIFAGGSCVIALIIAPETGGLSMTVCHAATKSAAIDVAISLPKHLATALVEVTTELTDEQRSSALDTIQKSSAVVDAVKVLRDLKSFTEATHTAGELAHLLSALLRTAGIHATNEGANLKGSIEAARDHTGNMIIIMDSLPLK